MSMSINLSGTCVVTGGNRGIGHAFSEALAKAGCNVAMIYRSHPKAPETAKALQERFKNVKVQAYKCDVRDFDMLQETFFQIEGNMGDITGVIANAGISIVKPGLELNQDDFEKIFGVNVFGVFSACSAAANLWKKTGRKGSIVIMGSTSGQAINQVAPNTPLTQAFHGSSKAAVCTLGKELAVKWAANNIRVNTLSPGYVTTEQTKDIKQSILKHQRDSVPLGRFAEPKEIAMVFLLSDGGSYVTGSDFIVNGGKLL